MIHDDRGFYGEQTSPFSLSGNRTGHRDKGPEPATDLFCWPPPPPTGGSGKESTPTMTLTLFILQLLHGDTTRHVPSMSMLCL